VGNGGLGPMDFEILCLVFIFLQKNVFLLVLSWQNEILLWLAPLEKCCWSSPGKMQSFDVVQQATTDLYCRPLEKIFPTPMVE